MIYFEKELNVPLCFSVVEKTQERSIYNADDLLKFKYLRKYSKIERTGGSLILYKKTVRCPNCGREYAAPHRFRYNLNESTKYLKMQMKDLIEPQMRLLVKENKNIVLQDDADDGVFCICARCGTETQIGNDMIRIKIESTESEIIVSRLLNRLQDLMNCQWADEIDLGSVLGITENICFDFSSGNTQICIKDNNGQIVISENIENTKVDLENDTLIKLINENRVVKRNLRRAVETATGRKMPFSCTELNMEYFVLFTRFQGFNRGFYDAAPFSADPFRLDFTFDSIVSRLKTPESAMQALKDSALPFTKSVKRIFVNNQGLFFYIKDCELLYSVLNDINYLSSVLKSDCIYTILLILHKSPQAIEFIKALFEAKGIGFMCKFFSLPFYDHFQIACCYSALLPEYKSIVRSSLKKYTYEDFMRVNYFSMLKISYPCSDIISRIPEKTVNGFSFKWFSNLHSCWRAGEKLQNCLADWDKTRGAVAGMFHSTALIAALEIRPHYKGGYEIAQAYEKGNADIEKDSAVYSAIVRWCEMFNVKYKRFFEER